MKIRQVEIPKLPTGSKDIKILHLSDLHLRKKPKRLLNALEKINFNEISFVIVTGDFLSSEKGIEIFFENFESILQIPGFYVFGSNDYFKPIFKNPLSYLFRNSSDSRRGSQLPWHKLDRELTNRGWINLTHNKVTFKIREVNFEMRGTDDAHLSLDKYALVSGNPKKNSISILVTHAPYLRLLKSAIADRLDLIMSGHTHGGQIRFPWFGESRALTTNCDLPNSMSRGLHKLTDKTWLHISAGIGTSPFAPIRILSPSEFTLITFVELQSESG